MVYNENRFLTLDEMTVNANYILSFLTGKGWTKNAVCGMLGNMQTESSINPGIWQGLNSYDSTPYATVAGQGYGLVQWTPFNKYTIWARDNGLQYNDIDSELKRILYEVANGIQYFSPNGTFEDFTKSTSSPYDLAMDFIAHYERPADSNQPIRGQQAQYWFDNLTGGGTIDPPPDDGKKGSGLIHLYLCDALTGWK